jgi:hypothetical protein
VALASGGLGTALPAVLGGGPLASLIFSIVGMIVRPFAMTAGRRRRLRIAMTVLVTLGALGLQYVGATFIVSPIVGTAILPGSDVLVVHEDRPPDGGEQSSTPSPPTPTSVSVANWLKMTPNDLVCKPGCNLAVTIKNTIGKTIGVDGIDFTGDDKEDFRYQGGCRGIALSRQQECKFTIVFDPADPAHGSQADLNIHHNQSGSPFIRHVTSVATPPKQPDLGVGGVTCTYAPTSTLGLEGAVAIAFPLTISGSVDNLPKKITVIATTRDGKTSYGTASLPGKASVALAVTKKDFSSNLDVTVLVDSDHAIKESNEENNAVQVTVSPPKNPKEKQQLDCSA